MAMNHDVQDGRDAAARARTTNGARPRPIRFEHDVWLIMRNDPVLPAAIIQRLRDPNGREFFVVLSWGLDPKERRMIGRYATLEDADSAVRYVVPPPIR
ncbi:MAG TPA: hypothetical protein VGF80_13460 [Galbitalea sp.]|jgi:hypothetical protein